MELKTLPLEAAFLTGPVAPTSIWELVRNTKSQTHLKAPESETLRVKPKETFLSSDDFEVVLGTTVRKGGFMACRKIWQVISM